VAADAFSQSIHAAALPKTALPSSCPLVWSLIRRPDQLSELEQDQLAHLRPLAPIQIAYDLAQRFIGMVRERAHDQLDDCLTAATNSKVKELRNFAEGPRRDYAAVKAPLQTEWSNGQTGGQINKLKLLKRTRYGRAKLDLLRARLLWTP
jgi:transposase